MANIQDLARLHRWKPDQVQGIRLKLADLFQAPKVSWQLAGRLSDDFYARDWTRSHGNLYQAIRMEKAIIGLLLLLIVAVAAIMAIFMVQGTVIGVVGTVLGAALGSLASLYISSAISGLESLFGFKILNAAVYFIDYIPAQLLLGDVLLVSAAALLLSFFATLYPAWRAARTQPAEALRYE
ncbi:MAG: hypothetical protein CFE49_19210 [Pseudomonas sp. PGPPP3]|nr:MAG: hypothetical protein CFE49_19210 [Pseudomonas sp. PGPPP3]